MHIYSDPKHHPNKDHKHMAGVSVRVWWQERPPSASSLAHRTGSSQSPLPAPFTTPPPSEASIPIIQAPGRFVVEV